MPHLRLRHALQSQHVVVGDDAHHAVLRVHHRQPCHVVGDQQLQRCGAVQVLSQGLGFKLSIFRVPESTTGSPVTLCETSSSSAAGRG